MSSPQATPVRSRGVGALEVGDYVGQQAADAAQAVRRAGLRPALERCVAVAYERAGTVVVQDPTAGTLLARNTMVTLHVAAPAPGPPESTAQNPALAAQPALEDTETTIADSRAVEEARSGSLGSPGPASVSRTRPAVQPEPAWAEPPAAEPEAGEPSVEELRARLGDVLEGYGDAAGRAGRVYPRRARAPRLTGARTWVASHRSVFAIVCVAVLAWVAVALAGSTSTTPHRPAPSEAGLMEPASREQRPLANAPARSGAQPAPKAHRRAHSGLPTAQARLAPATRHPKRNVAVRRPVSTPEPVEATTPSTSSTPAETPGGPFSP